jgi:hypothetical protein
MIELRPLLKRAWANSSLRIVLLVTQLFAGCPGLEFRFPAARRVESAGKQGEVQIHSGRRVVRRQLRSARRDQASRADRAQRRIK